jgi:thioredoxin 1
LPAIYLRRYYFEGLLECVRGLTGAAPRKAGENHHVSMLTRSNFDAETDRGLVLVDFMAHWCGPCKLLAPELEKLARQHRGEIRVGRVTADRHRELMERFDITSFPMLVLLKDGEEVARLDKYRAYPELLKWIRAALPDERSAPSARLLQAGPASAGDGGYGQRFVQPFAWPARLQLDDHVRRPGERVDSVHPARATYRVADGEAFSSLVRACEQPEATSTHPKVGSRT